MYTTLNELRIHSPCELGWEKLLKHLEKTKSDDEPLSFLTLLESNGLDDALWCLRAAPKDWEPGIRMYAVWCAKQVEHLMTDKRSKNALLVAQNHALGLATDEELAAAGDAAWASLAAGAASLAAWSAAWAAGAAARDAQKEMFIAMCEGTAPWQVK